MSRVEKAAGNRSMAFGVDFAKQPGTPHSFVQVWDNSEEESPCNEGEDGFNNILIDEWDIQEERVVELAQQHSIPIDPTEVWETFD